MSRYRIIGGQPLSGEVDAAGNKNAVLKMIPATLLTRKEVTLTNIPNILDVDVTLEIMKDLGAEINYDKEDGILKLKTEKLNSSAVNPRLARKLRASNMYLGPILARKGEVTNVFPGGDKIGPRDMSAHFDGFAQLGADMQVNADNSFTISGKLQGTDIFMYAPSVTGTENIILASVCANGKSIIENAACEPHVAELCHMLNQMGADIKGIGTNRLEINGTGGELLGGTEYMIPPDFIYIGTFIVLAAITGGEILIKNVIHEDLRSILYFFGKLGVKTEAKGNDLLIPANQTLKIDDATWARNNGIYSQPWPNFPTDLMSLAIVLGTQTEGSTLFFEKMYPGRMFFANYLNGMGANIIMADPHRIVVNGKTTLKGVKGLKSPDLRAGMAYVAAALCAEGESRVDSIDHISRGYPDLDKVLKSLGAHIELVEK